MTGISPKQGSNLWIELYPLRKITLIPEAAKLPEVWAASSVYRSTEISFQNARPAVVANFLIFLFNTSTVEMLQQPIELAQYVSVEHQALLIGHNLVNNMSHKGNCWKQHDDEALLLEFKDETNLAKGPCQSCRNHQQYC